MEQTKYDMSHTIFSMVVDDNGKTNIKWNYNLLSKESFESLRVIHKLYDDQCFIWLNDNRKNLKPKNERTCRFCGKSYPEVSFSKKAHLIPESIGNKLHLSDFECDICNYKFSSYENDFINFLGPYRAISEIPKKGGFPKYKSRNKKMTIEQAYKNAVDLNLTNQDAKNNLSYDAKKNVMRIQTEGDPYKPIGVFKCLLKTAISLVDEVDLEDLTNTIKFLMDDNYVANPSYDFILSMHQFFIPGNFNIPPFLVYYKKSIDFVGFAAPTQFFIFYIRNLVFQIFIPFNAKDSFMYNASNKRHMYIVPPLVNNLWFDKYGGPFPRLINLNESNVNKNNIQVVEYMFTK